MDILVEPCPQAEQFQINGCKDSAQINLNGTELTSLGRIVQLNTTIKNVCPRKRVAVAVQLMEVDGSGKEYSRGLKFLEIPEHTEETCKDIEIKCIRFVLPESLDVTGNTQSICNSRSFKAYVMANYIDTDFSCCDTKITVQNSNKK